MPHPVRTMLKLNEAELDLLMVQGWIDNARIACATNQVVQLELDRRQSELDTKLARIHMARAAIALSN
jgi:hypothetical protein